MNNVLGDHPCEKDNVTIATILEEILLRICSFLHCHWEEWKINMYVYRFKKEIFQEEWKISATLYNI